MAALLADVDRDRQALVAGVLDGFHLALAHRHALADALRDLGLGGARAMRTSASSGDPHKNGLPNQIERDPLYADSAAMDRCPLHHATNDFDSGTATGHCTKIPRSDD